MIPTSVPIATMLELVRTIYGVEKLGRFHPSVCFCACLHSPSRLLRPWRRTLSTEFPTHNHYRHPVWSFFPCVCAHTSTHTERQHALLIQIFRHACRTVLLLAKPQLICCLLPFPSDDRRWVSPAEQESEAVSAQRLRPIKQVDVKCPDGRKPIDE